MSRPYRPFTGRHHERVHHRGRPSASDSEWLLDAVTVRSIKLCSENGPNVFVLSDPDVVFVGLDRETITVALDRPDL
ncbi:hypothetical protein ACNS7O_06675 [Haloferacaceae archaeon DSL9]